jgi:hypothetical protein
MKPSNRVRVFYEGDPMTARVELIVMGDDGIEAVYDIPAEAVTVHFAAGKRSSCVLLIGETFVTVHSEGPIDALLEERLRRVANLPKMVAFEMTPGETTHFELPPFDNEPVTKVETPNPKARKKR